ncbi:hypothetical protein LguiB_027118 [Lonicera macranthoides]
MATVVMTSLPQFNALRPNTSGSSSTNEAKRKGSFGHPLRFHWLIHKSDNGGINKLDAVCREVWTGTISKQKGNSRAKAGDKGLWPPKSKPMTHLVSPLPIPWLVALLVTLLVLELFLASRTLAPFEYFSCPNYL